MNEIPRDVGTLLKHERTSKGIALDMVHEATKIPLDALKAIEEGYKARSLTGFYYKSFVKIYAQYLGLDAGVVLAMVPVHHPQSPAVLKLPKPAKGLAVGAHRVEGVRERMAVLRSPDILRKKKKVIVVVLAGVCILAGLFAAGVLIRKVVNAIAVSRALDAASNSNGQSRKTKINARPANMSGKPLAAAASPADKAQTRPARSTGRVAVTVRAQTTTWITVRCDGATVFQDRLKKGTAESWSSAKKIEISVQDLGALEFEVNGKNIGKIARRDMKARKVIVTPEGLTVEK